MSDLDVLSEYIGNVPGHYKGTYRIDAPFEVVRDRWNPNIERLVSGHLVDTMAFHAYYIHQEKQYRIFLGYSEETNVLYYRVEPYKELGE